MTKQTSPKTEAAKAPEPTGLRVETNFEVVDNTDVPEEVDAAPVSETERTLASGLTVVDYE